MIWLLVGLLSALAAPCELQSAPDAAFTVEAPEDAERVHVVLTLRLGDTESDLAWAEKMLAVLDARNVKAGLGLRVQEPSPGLASLVVGALEREHEVVVRLAENEVSKNAQKGPPLMRKRLKPLTSQFGKIRATETPLGSKPGEAILHRIGLRAVLETNGPATATPRRQLRFEGQPESGVVLPAGPYSGACGGESVVRGFTPPLADRATQALFGARSAGVGVVRVTVLPGSDDDATVLARWLDEVLKPRDIAIGTPTAAREASLKAFRSGSPDDWNPESTAGGRLVRVDEVVRAAEALAEVTTIPRALPGDLTPTEAFQAFLLVLAGDIEGSVVRLAALDGPPQLSKSTLSGPKELDREAVRKLAVALLAEMPDAIPAALPVDGTLLNAGELLVVLASAVTGGTPTARPVAVPEPNAAGLGWGSATTP